MDLEKHQERSKTEKQEFEAERAEMRNEISDLRERLRSCLEMIKRMEEKEKVLISLL